MSNSHKNEIKFNDLLQSLVTLPTRHSVVWSNAGKITENIFLSILLKGIPDLLCTSA